MTDTDGVGKPGAARNATALGVRRGSTRGPGPGISHGRLTSVARDCPSRWILGLAPPGVAKTLTGSSPPCGVKFVAVIPVAGPKHQNLLDDRFWNFRGANALLAGMVAGHSHKRHLANRFIRQMWKTSISD